MSSTQGQNEQDRVSNLEARFTNFEATQNEILKILAAMQARTLPTESVGEVPAMVDRGKGILIDEEVESHQVLPAGARGSPAQRLREQEGLGREPHALMGPRNPAPEVRAHVGAQDRVVNPRQAALDYQERGQEPRREQFGRKLEMPICDGQNVRDWIYRAERYFDVNQLTPGERLSAAGLCLEDKALSWFRWRQVRDPIRTWGELREGILERFQGTEADHEQFFALVQSGSVAEYRDRFEELSAGLEGLTDEAILGAFLKGLKDPVRSALRPFKPGTIREAMEMAQLIEERDARTPIVRPSTIRGPAAWGPSSRPNQSTALMQRPREPMKPNPVGPANPRRISETDYADKRAKGLCFRCDEKWSVGHICKNRHLNFILVSEDGTETESSDDEEDLTEIHAKVSLNSINGLTPARCMKLRGRIKGREVTVLIDSGATHNFISRKLAESCNIRTEDQGKFRVTLGNGMTEAGQGQCPNVKIELPDYTTEQNFLILNIHGTDAILGMTWLETLGEVKTNWGIRTMEFRHGNQMIRLQGEDNERVAEENFAAISMPQVLDWEALDSDNQSAALKESREKAENGDPEYTVHGQRLFYKGRFMLPRSSAQIPKLLQEFHASAPGGHSGVLKTYMRIRKEFYWEGMKRDVEKMVGACHECQQSKHSTLAPSGLLQPLALPDKVWSEISMDFIEGLPKVEGYSVILVVVDRLSKYAHFIPLSHPYTARSVAMVFIKEIVRLHGIPEGIVSDRDAIFTSIFWQKLFEALGTKLKRSSAYHPQTDGQTEVVNRSVGTYLRCFASHQPKEWVKYLPWAEYWYNTSYHTATKLTPFQILYGREPPRLVPYPKGSSPAQRVDEELIDRDRVIKDLAKQLAKSQQSMKASADKHRKDEEFRVGDIVYVKLQHRRQQSLAQRTEGYKLSPVYYGPYKIERRIGKVAYRIQLPEESQIYPVFHVSQLKLCKGQLRPSDVHKLRWKPGYVPTYTPKELIGVRKGGKGVEVLLRWTRLPDDEATWEPLDFIHERFPEFDLKNKAEAWLGGDQPAPVEVQRIELIEDLEDKVQLKGAGIDKTLENSCQRRADYDWSETLDTPEGLPNDTREKFGAFWGLRERSKEPALEVRSIQGPSEDPCEDPASEGPDSSTFEDLPEGPTQQRAEKKGTARGPARASQAREVFLNSAHVQFPKSQPRPEFPKINQRPRFPKAMADYARADFPSMSLLPKSSRFPNLQDSYQQLKIIKKPIFPKGSKLPKSDCQQTFKNLQRLSTRYGSRMFPNSSLFLYFRSYLQARNPSNHRISKKIRKPKFPKPPSRVPINREL